MPGQGRKIGTGDRQDPVGRELGSEVQVESKEVRKKNWASADIRKSHDVLRKILYYSVNLAIQELLPV